jgi:CRP-like cAMP-binding protein
MNNTMSKARDERLVHGVVANLPLFWGVPPAHLDALTRQCWATPAARGTTVLAQGARLPGILALAYGSVKLVLRRADRAERVLRIIGALQTFGDSSALLGRGSPYDAVALNESKLVVIPTSSLFALLERDPRFARRLVLALAERKVELYGEMQSATLLSSTQRLASYLKELAGAERTVSLPFSKTLVASRLGIKKETLSRLLRDLVDQRVIDVTRRDIAILEPARLGELAGEPIGHSTGA